MKNTPHLNDTERLALSASEVAKLLGISTRHLWSLNSSGRLPRPIKLGVSTRWNASELRAWLDAGAPPRHQWEAMRQ